MYSNLRRGEKSHEEIFCFIGKEISMPDHLPKTHVFKENGESYVLKFMELRQVMMIDEALSSVGDYGEVRLVVEKGRLRFFGHQSQL